MQIWRTTAYGEGILAGNPSGYCTEVVAKRALRRLVVRCVFCSSGVGGGNDNVHAMSHMLNTSCFTVFWPPGEDTRPRLASRSIAEMPPCFFRTCLGRKEF